MPGVRTVLTALKPEIEVIGGLTLGAKLLGRRRELGLTREEAAQRIGTSWKSLMWWERSLREPEDRFFPALIRYLGSEPWEEPGALAAALQAERRRRGLPVKAAATLVGVDEGTWLHWERQEWKPTGRTIDAIRDFLGFCPKERFPGQVR